MEDCNNCKIVTSDSKKSEPIEINIATYNVANSLLDEKSDINNFFLREEFILKLITKLKETGIDILTLTELRPYKNRITGEMRYPPYFLGKINEYAHIYDYMSGNPLSFAMAILYDRTKVYPVKTVKYWLSETYEVPSDSWVMVLEEFHLE